jgi:hypothetical protein
MAASAEVLLKNRRVDREAQLPRPGDMVAGSWPCRGSWQTAQVCGSSVVVPSLLTVLIKRRQGAPLVARLALGLGAAWSLEDPVPGQLILQVIVIPRWPGSLVATPQPEFTIAAVSAAVGGGCSGFRGIDHDARNGTGCHSRRILNVIEPGPVTTRTERPDRLGPSPRRSPRRL